MRLSVRRLTVSFQKDRQRLTALQDVTFESAHGEFVAIVGPSGCGKTTLLRTIAGILEPDAGVVETIPSDSDAGRPVRLVFQEHALFPWKTVLDNAAFGLLMTGVPREEAESRARGMLALVGLAGWEDSWPHQLSMGMRQRVNVVRCFLCHPALMLMDEPFVALDAETRSALHQELLTLWQKTGQSVIFVTHDVDEAVLLSDRVLVMGRDGGRIVAETAVTLSRPRGSLDTIRPEFIESKRLILEALKGC